MTGAEETKGIVLKTVVDRIDKLHNEGCSNLKLHEQRMHQMEEILKDLKANIKSGFGDVANQITSLDKKVSEAMATLEDKNTRRFDKLNALVVGILLFTMALAFMAGINVWEMAKDLIK